MVENGLEMWFRSRVLSQHAYGPGFNPQCSKRKRGGGQAVNLKKDLE